MKKSSKNSKQGLTNQEYDLKMSSLDARKWIGNMHKTAQIHLTVRTMEVLEKILRKEEKRLKPKYAAISKRNANAKKLSERKSMKRICDEYELYLELTKVQLLK